MNALHFRYASLCIKVFGAMQKNKDQKECRKIIYCKTHCNKTTLLLNKQPTIQQTIASWSLHVVIVYRNTDLLSRTFLSFLFFTNSKIDFISISHPFRQLINIAYPKDVKRIHTSQKYHWKKKYAKCPLHQSISKHHFDTTCDANTPNHLVNVSTTIV